MKAILKILIAAAILNAAARAGIVAWNYYQLRDEAQQVILFGADFSTSDLTDRILDKAAELDVPLEPDGIVVSREGNQTFVEASYTQPVEFFPTFQYPLELSFMLENFAMDPVR